jgi:hypothetical protein
VSKRGAAGEGWGDWTAGAGRHVRLVVRPASRRPAFGLVDGADENLDARGAVTTRRE